MTEINGYLLKHELKTTNSGFSKWGFAQRGGDQFFIKEFIDPVWPVFEEMLDPSLVERKKKICLEYEERSKVLYKSINECSDGNLVYIEDFFRYGSHYYMVMEKVDVVRKEEIQRSDIKDRERICKVLVHSLSCLHEKGIVHADIKMDNILFRRLPSGKLTGKVIDFDNCFWESQPPRPDEEIHGDLVYMAPETFMMMQTETGKIDRAVDVFALGLVLHEIFTGELPLFDAPGFDYPFEAVLGGVRPVIRSSIPENWRQIITQMLEGNPEKRISLAQIQESLNSGRSTDTEKEYPGFFMPGGDL